MGDCVLPDWLKDPLDELGVVFTIVLALIGLYGLILPTEFAFYYGTFTLLYIVLFFYARKKAREKRVLKARLQSAENKYRNGLVHGMIRTRIEKTSDASLVEKATFVPNEGMVLIPRKTALVGDLRDEPLKVKKGQQFRISYKADREISLYVMDKWHHDRMSFVNPLLSENNVIEGTTAPHKHYCDSMIFLVILNESIDGGKAKVEFEVIS